MTIADEEPTGDEERDFHEMLTRFRQGIEENIDEADFQSHYDLGIAFKEMGLLDEAIAELQKALRAPEGKLRVSEALGACFLEKGAYVVAESILRRALDLPSSGDQERLGILYWLGRAVVELMHLATLVHDDSVDHAVLRRGRPTINALFSPQIAVIMGDYLYSRAIIELVALDDLEPLRVFARVTNEMTIGEMRQLEAHDKLAYSEAAYDQLIRSKTASLLSAACEVGALRAAAEHREALARFGEHLGMPFQITDDLLDYTESEEVTGKPVGLDLKEHKVTLPLIAALGHMGQPERRVVADLMAAPDPPDDLVAQVIGLVGAAGGVDRARSDRARRVVAGARRRGDRLLLRPIDLLTRGTYVWGPVVQPHPDPAARAGAGVRREADPGDRLVVGSGDQGVQAQLEGRGRRAGPAAHRSARLHLLVPPPGR